MDQAFSFVIYPLLFLALYVEVFFILSFFEQDARRRRALPPAVEFPSVSIIVPCYNEERSVAQTAASVLALDYPKEKLKLILVNDGSTDNTAAAIDALSSHPQVTIIHKENGGKHTALNAGIAAADTEFVGGLDADSFVSPDALRLVMANFDEARIGAVTSSMSVYEPKNILERMQEAEYLLGITMRHTLATWNGLYVTPGPFTIYRKRAFEEVGEFRPAHNTEDLEIALRLQKFGWKIQNAPGASVFTTAPKTVRALVKQRVRWTTGFMRNLIDYRELIGNRAYGVLGLLVLPLGLFSVFAGVALFGISTVRFISDTWRFALRASEVPLSYTFTAHMPNWFYFPTSALMILTAVIITLTVGLIFSGAFIARKKTKLGFALPWYFLIYSFVSVWWRARSIADVTLGTRRSWR